MLKSNFPHQVRRLCISCLAVVALNSAASQTDLPLDLSILKQRNVLAQSMDASERVNLLKLETKIEEAESDIRSGEYMMQTKPSAFKDDNEVKEAIQRGKELVEEATLRLYETQKALVDFLSTAQAERASKLAVAAKKFNFTIESHTYEKAFQASTKALLEAARVKGYKTVFFDKILLVNEDGSQPISTNARNDAYDTLVKIDGTNFSLSLPIGLELGKDSKLTFDNIEDYGKEKIALLAIELHQQVEGEGLLYMRLIDLKSYLIIDQKLTHTTEVGELLAKEEAPTEAEENLEDTTAEVEAPIKSPAPATTKQLVGAEVIDEGMWIDRLAQQAYKFKIVTSPSDSLIPAICLTHTISNLTAMKLLDEDYILRAYGSETTDFKSKASAQFTLNGTDNQFELSARSYSSDRTIKIGSMELNYE